MLRKPLALPGNMVLFFYIWIGMEIIHTAKIFLSRLKKLFGRGLVVVMMNTRCPFHQIKEEVLASYWNCTTTATFLFFQGLGDPPQTCWQPASARKDLPLTCYQLRKHPAIIRSRIYSKPFIGTSFHRVLTAIISAECWTQKADAKQPSENSSRQTFIRSPILFMHK